MTALNAHQNLRTATSAISQTPGEALGWTVAYVAATTDSVQLVTSERHARLTVGDGTTTAAQACRRTVVLRDDGTAHLPQAAAPPALLFTAAGVQALPALPGDAAVTSMQPGERLFVLSANSFAALPTLRLSGRTAADGPWPGDPLEVLVQLSRTVATGSGALVTRNQGGAMTTSTAFLAEIDRQRRQAVRDLTTAVALGDPLAAADARDRLADLDELWTRNDGDELVMALTL